LRNKRLLGIGLLRRERIGGRKAGVAFKVAPRVLQLRLVLRVRGDGLGG
jgi:hypothetical protein